VNFKKSEASYEILSLNRFKSRPLTVGQKVNFMMKKHVLAIGLLALMLSLIRSPLSQATLVRPLNLQELTEQADVIVKAKLISRQNDDDPEESKRLVTYYTFEVLDWVKGQPTADSKLVIKQVAQGEFTDDSGKTTRQNFYFPEYQVGKTYLLFLPTAHEKTGLMAPIGLDQGVYDVQTVNGQDVLPQLQKRASLLTHGLQSSSRYKGLTRMLTGSPAASNKYEDLKSQIQSVGASQ
jgi:hypothetical protein